MSKKIFQIREYGFFYKEKHGIDSERLFAEGNVMIPDEVFDYLEIFLQIFFKISSTIFASSNSIPKVNDFKNSSSYFFILGIVALAFSVRYRE